MLWRILNRALRFVVALAIVLALTWIFRKVLPANHTTIALFYLLAILAVSAAWGFTVSAFMSVAAMLAFNYFFLPPVGKFTVADPQNYVALFAFLATSLTGSQLSQRMKRQAEEAHRRRDEAERLYMFSQRLLVSGNVITLLNAIPQPHRGIVRDGSGGALSGEQEEILSRQAASTWMTKRCAASHVGKSRSSIAARSL